MDFFEKLIQEIISNIDHNYTDNYDWYRFGPATTHTDNIRTIKQYIIYLLHKSGYYKLATYKNEISKQITEQIEANPDAVVNCHQLYDMLEDEHSKDLLIKILCYAIMGPSKIKLPYSTPKYWAKIKEIETFQDKSDIVSSGFMDFKLYKTHLKGIGYPIEFYYTALGIMIDFVIKQYEYRFADTVIKAEKGDVVIDAGGCWGDTALYFASEVGSNGVVYSFEFIPSNIDIFNKNINMNPSLKETVKLVKTPLWGVSGTPVFFHDNGPGSKISFTNSSEMNGKTNTISIDDWVKEEKIDKVDFIKMDIEGAETDALSGSIETIKRFKPKLAICIYHKWADFSGISKWIDSLNLGYKFYITHNTIHLEETVLFAQA